jgi:very-short-patch-repair endonuclease
MAGEMLMDTRKRERKHGGQSSGVVCLQYVDERKKTQSRRLRKECTPAEKRLWQYLRNRGVDGLKFRRQQVIEGFVADFYCEKAKLVIELDGAVHNKPEQQKRDVYREKVFAARGIATLRLRNGEIFTDLQKCLMKIKNATNKQNPS